MFLPGNTLTSRALGNKLLLVEEWAYAPSKLGLNYKKPDIWDQGNALNYRGIPWVRPVLSRPPPSSNPLPRSTLT
jgi:hypothetical protein